MDHAFVNVSKLGLGVSSAAGCIVGCVGRCSVASKGTAETALRVTAGDDVLVAVDFIPRSTPNGDQTLGRSEVGSATDGDATGTTVGNGAVAGAGLDIGNGWVAVDGWFVPVA